MQLKGGIMAKCDFCGREVAYPYRCRYCGGLFCEDHRLPPNHRCPGIELWKSKAPSSFQDTHSEGVLLKPVYYTSSLRKSIRRRRERKVKALIGIFVFLAIVLISVSYFSPIIDVSKISSIVSEIKPIKPLPIVPSKPTPVDLREKLWRYELKKALEVALSSSELSKIEYLATELKGKDIRESAWNILLWEEDNIEYDYLKANVSPPIIYYTKDPYYGVITNVEVVGGTSDYYQTPYETIKKGKGVCRDYAILTAGLLLAMNYSLVYVLDINYINKITGHVATAIKIDDQYFILDQHPPVRD